MNLRQNKKLMLVGALAILLNVSSCSKYEDGPMFSLKTKISRLTGVDWEVIEVDNVDVSNGYKMILDFDKDGDFTFTSSYPSGYGYDYDNSITGEWQWEDGKETIELDFDNGFRQDLEIKRLTNSEFWFEDEDNIEIELEKI